MKWIHLLDGEKAQEKTYLNNSHFSTHKARIIKDTLQTLLSSAMNWFWYPISISGQMIIICALPHSLYNDFHVGEVYSKGQGEWDRKEILLDSS